MKYMTSRETQEFLGDVVVLISRFLLCCSGEKESISHRPTQFPVRNLHVKFSNILKAFLAKLFLLSVLCHLLNVVSCFF